MRKLAIILLLLSFGAHAQQHYPIKNMYGVNAHDWDFDTVMYPAKYKAFVDAGFSFIRVYTDVYASKDINGGFALNPDLRGFWLDSSLRGLKKDLPNLKTIICWQNQSRSIQPTWPQGSTVDRPYSLSADDTASYNEIRKDAYVLAARGGTNKSTSNYPVYNSPYWWEPRQVMYKGAGFYDVVEYMNEPDMDYTFGKLSGAQVAVANSATYDGAKAADPNITISSSGCADGTAAKFDSIAAWCVKNRGGKLPFNIYQHHAYYFGWKYGMAGRIPIEIDGLAEEIKIVEHAAKFGVPVLVGEYGTDKAQRSYLAAPKYSLGQYDQDHSQAIINLRDFLCFARAGVYAATYYRSFYDYNQNANESNETLFASTAAFKDVYENNQTIVRQLHCDWQKQVKDYFGEYTYTDNPRDDTVKDYRFKNAAKEVRAIWAVEILSSWNDNGTTRPLLIERKAPYYLPAGTIYQCGDSGQMMISKHDAGPVALTAKPIFYVADLTILPVRDSEPRPPINGKKYHIKVYRLMDGVKVVDKKDADLEQTIKTLLKLTPYVIQYFDNKNFYSKKIIKQ